jgi:hypothetical protein
VDSELSSVLKTRKLLILRSHQKHRTRQFRDFRHVLGTRISPKRRTTHHRRIYLIGFVGIQESPDVPLPISDRPGDLFPPPGDLPQVQDRNEEGPGFVRGMQTRGPGDWDRGRTGINSVLHSADWVTRYDPDLSRPSSPQSPQPAVRTFAAAPCCLNGTQDLNFAVPGF